MKETINYSKTIEATQALITFCQEQDYRSSYLDSIKECLRALESGDEEGAIKHYEAVPLGGMGCFNDWTPTPKAGLFSANSTGKISEQFDEIIKKWSLAMRSLRQSTESKP